MADPNNPSLPGKSAPVIPGGSKGTLPQPSTAVTPNDKFTKELPSTVPGTPRGA